MTDACYKLRYICRSEISMQKVSSAGLIFLGRDNVRLLCRFAQYLTNSFEKLIDIERLGNIVVNFQPEGFYGRFKTGESRNNNNWECRIAGNDTFNQRNPMIFFRSITTFPQNNLSKSAPPFDKSAEPLPQWEISQRCVTIV